MIEEDNTTAGDAIDFDDEILGVTHAEAMAFAENYNKGWDAIKKIWEIVMAIGFIVVFIGIVAMFFGEYLIAFVSIFIGFITIVFGYDKLKHVKVAQNFMLEANIRIRAEK